MLLSLNLPPPSHPSLSARHIYELRTAKHRMHSETVMGRLANCTPGEKTSRFVSGQQAYSCVFLIASSQSNCRITFSSN